MLEKKIPFRAFIISLGWRLRPSFVLCLMHFHFHAAPNISLQRKGWLLLRLLFHLCLKETLERDSSICCMFLVQLLSPPLSCLTNIQTAVSLSLILPNAVKIALQQQQTFNCIIETSFLLSISSPASESCK